MERLEELLSGIKPLDKKWMETAQKKLDSLTKPKGSLGRLEEFAKKVAAIKQETEPKLNRKVIFTMAGDHGVADEGVSAFPKEVTQQMVLNFINQGAGINVLARYAGAKVVVVDIGVDGKIDTANLETNTESVEFRDKKIANGTDNFTKCPAMSYENAVKSILTGGEVFLYENNKKRIDIVGTGDMGIANTTASAAIISVITSSKAADIAGRGTGIDEKSLNKKIAVIEKGISVNKPNPTDPIDVLACIGGYEIGGLAGVMLAAAYHRVPIVVDGFISTAAALIAISLNKFTKNYMFFSHISQEKGHKEVLNWLKLRPILDLDLRLGEGTGAVLAMNIIEAGVKIMNEMATFKKANVATGSEHAHS